MSQENWNESQWRYEASDKGKKRQAKYNTSDKGKERYKRCRENWTPEQWERSRERNRASYRKRKAKKDSQENS